MRITERIAVRLQQLRSLFSNKEKIMSDQTVINPTSAAAQQELSPLESFANETASAPAVPAAATSASDAVAQDISAGVKDFVQAFSFVEQGVLKLGSAAKDELIALAKKYL
ncbi:MAG: hypothetical protein FT714_15915 [Pantoea sp. Pent]|nr:hypothetical protein [Pantoea sp. Pent]